MLLCIHTAALRRTMWTRMLSQTARLYLKPFFLNFLKKKSPLPSSLCTASVHSFLFGLFCFVCLFSFQKRKRNQPKKHNNHKKRILRTWLRDRPLSFFHLHRFYRTRGRYPGHTVSFEPRLVDGALGLPRNLIVLPWPHKKKKKRFFFGGVRTSDDFSHHY